jgi:uncharacterized protein YjbI with pentapeptide repeats
VVVDRSALRPQRRSAELAAGLCVSLFAAVVFASSARADIFQWEYIDPADPSQGKRQSTTLAPDGAGVDAVPGADLWNRDLTMAYLIGADLTGASGGYAILTNADLSQANLTEGNFIHTTLSGADFTGTWVKAADFTIISGAPCYPCGDITFGTGISPAQLYSTSSYQASDLREIRLVGNDFTGGRFGGQNLAKSNLSRATLTSADFRQANLTNATFYYATLTDANFTDADIRGASFYRGGSCSYQCEPVGTGITLPQLYSTASYQAHDLTGIDLGFNDLRGANFTGQNLTNADFFAANLTDADFAGADISGASFARGYNSIGRPPGLRGTGITLAQLYSTASYQAKDLSGIRLDYNNLAGGNFAGQNLTNSFFFSATLEGADFTGADMRGVTRIGWINATAANLIGAGGNIIGLELNSGRMLVLRDYDGNPSPLYSDPIPPIPIRIDQHLAIGPGGTLRMVFEADAWDSTISFAPGIPVTLGGTLELAFADDVNLASQIGRTFDLFDWTGVNPTGQFTIASPYAWNLSNLYTTGEVILTAVPEPAICTLVVAGACALTYHRRRKIS